MNNIIITGKMHPGFDKILTEDAQEFLVKLHQRYNNTRKAVLDRRNAIHHKILSPVGSRFFYLKQHLSAKETGK